MPETISVGQYILWRLRELGTHHIFGVPGDFNLALLDEICNVPDLTWIGCCNELNAAYAADGFTRIKGSPGALITTFAVGELSALNGIVGAYAEHAGMIHIVGMPARSTQKVRSMVHHTYKANMDFTTYTQSAEPYRQALAYLVDESSMADDIDRAMGECVKSRLPVYIYVPVDVVPIKLDADRLKTPLDTTVRNPDSKTEEQIIDAVLSAIEKSSNPVILADVIAIRHGGQEVTRELAEMTQFPSFSTNLSKGIFDETAPHYYGVYNGTASFPGIKAAVENSDLVINLGPLLSDSNTGGFTREIKDEGLISLGHDCIRVLGREFQGFHFLPVLRRVVEELKGTQKHKYQLPRPNKELEIKVPLLNDSRTGPIQQSYLWQRLGRFLTDNDIVLAESGTAQFGMPDATFPRNTKWITQIYYSSIGYTVGACLGALAAARELQSPGRVVLIVGDGSLQMTVQEIGTYIRYGFQPIIFVINNDGYSIERAIHGPKQSYNDISTLWDYQKMLSFFGVREDTGVKGGSHAARTVEELELVLNDRDFGSGKSIQLCEVFTDQFDYPWRLSKQLELARATMYGQTPS